MSDIGQNSFIRSFLILNSVHFLFNNTLDLLIVHYQGRTVYIPKLKNKFYTLIKTLSTLFIRIKTRLKITTIIKDCFLENLDRSFFI